MRRLRSEMTPLQQRVAGAIIALARREDLPAGHHLGKIALAQEIGTSHNPVEAALAHLARIGVVRHEHNRGYFLAKPAQKLGAIAEKFHPSNDDPLYFRIAECRLTHRLPDVVNESDLIRRFRTPRTAVRKALSRIQQEGWVERKPGHGWGFLPLIDSKEAYAESFEIRCAIEPSGILSTKFRPDAQALATIKRQQEFMAKSGYRTLSPIEWADINARFHETLASWSGNRFFLQTVRRLNQLRRLVEYKAVARSRAPRKVQAAEHLAIITAIERGDYRRAASMLRNHLEGASREKVRRSLFELRK